MPRLLKYFPVNCQKLTVFSINSNSVSLNNVSTSKGWNDKMYCSSVWEIFQHDGNIYVSLSTYTFLSHPSYIACTCILANQSWQYCSLVPQASSQWGKGAHDLQCNYTRGTAPQFNVTAIFVFHLKKILRSSTIFKRIRLSSIWKNIEVTFHISTSWVKIRLHTKNNLLMLSGSALKV